MRNQLLWSAIFLIVLSTSTAAQTASHQFLETALQCQSKPQPAKIIQMLQTRGDIGYKPYLVADSINFFKARKPITVWGLKVDAVFGFDHDPKVFDRGPGTAPPITIGVLVSNPLNEVKSYLEKLGFKNLKVERAEEYQSPKKGSSPERTWILCEGEL